MKDFYCSYYTESDDITSYMVSKVKISPKDMVLEPSAGEGVFIDEILKRKVNVRIDALDINERAIEVLNRKYNDNSDVRVRHTDTLFDEQLDIFGSCGGHYDKVIGNPPYGAWQDYEKRDLLKRKYAGQYVKETYTLFLLRCLSVLKMGGRLSFIIPDTFLFLHMHERLRKILLTNTKIEEVLIFPSGFFPGVSFGYSNLSIITLEKCGRDEALDNNVKIIRNFKSPVEFADVEDGKYPDHLEIFERNQKDVFAAEKSRFILAKEDVVSFIGENTTKLGDVADIVTGFYSGDNKRFICAKSETVRGSKGYKTIEDKYIFECCDLSGIKEVNEGYVPYIKSSSKTRYFRESDEWFVRWDSESIKYYKENKKSRFQNPQFYFKKGIAIPMVKASEIRATLMEHRVFDQSIVGIFPKDESNLLYMLALMNSDAINKWIHFINPTANNSSNYVKQLPYKEPAKNDRDMIEKNVSEILKLDYKNDAIRIGELHKQNNEIIERIYS